MLNKHISSIHLAKWPCDDGGNDWRCTIRLIARTDAERQIGGICFIEHAKSPWTAVFRAYRRASKESADLYSNAFHWPLRNHLEKMLDETNKQEFGEWCASSINHN